MKPFLGLALALVLIALPPHGTAAPKPKEEKDGLKQFEGAWTFLSWEQNGGTQSKEFLGEAKWTVKGDKYTFVSGDQTEEGTIKLDADKKPATIDFDITAGSDKGKKQPGIYKIEKGQLTLCLARPGETDRPTEFTAAEDKGYILIVLKRKDD